MPNAPKRPCLHPGCPALTEKPYCEVHDRLRKRQAWKRADLQRPSPSQRGYDARHRNWRRMVLNRHPVCPCGQAARVADHIVPLSRGGDWSLENGQGLCYRCHNRKTNAEMRPGFMRGTA